MSSLIHHWRQTGTWPKKYFEADEKTRAFFTRDLDEEPWPLDLIGMSCIDPGAGLEGAGLIRALLARPRSNNALRPVQSASGSGLSTPSDQRPREQKSAAYQSARYETLLATKGSHMRKERQGPIEESRTLCRILLEEEQPVPKESLFDKEIFEDTCEDIRNRNEAKVIRDIAPLIVPSPRSSIPGRPKSFDSRLVETVNEGWNNSIPFQGPRPQPDYAVGFDRSAFSKEQINKLQPFVGELTDTSFFMATYFMYLPFLTCEVKCGATALDIADRQNLHSMTLAVRGVVELFKLVSRESELDRQILAFSISHDDRTVRIYGHYPIIEGRETSFYRHPVHSFGFTALAGREKWTAYKFTKNLYEVWMPKHLKRICSVIDQLPADVSFELSESSELQFQETGLSQGLQDYALSQPLADHATPQVDSDERASVLPGATPDTSVSQPHPPQASTSRSAVPFKKPRKRPAAN